MSHPNSSYDPTDPVRIDDDRAAVAWPDGFTLDQMRSLKHELRTPLRILICKLAECCCETSEKSRILESATADVVRSENAHYEADSQEFVHEGEDYG